jgi:hypothetical protein
MIVDALHLLLRFHHYYHHTRQREEAFCCPGHQRNISCMSSDFPLQSQLLTLLQYVQLSEVFYILTTTMLKISLGLFFLRVLTKRWQRVLFHVVLGISATYGFFYVLSSIFACGNPAKIADTFLGSKKCLPSAFILATGYLYGTLNVLADWTFVLVPISVLLDSHLDRRSKISVSCVMALGAIGSVSSIMRMVYLEGLIGVPTGLSRTSSLLVLH